MVRNKGSISLVVLVSLLYLTVFAQLILQHIKNDFARTYRYVADLQQRKLCTSAMQWLVNNRASTSNFAFDYILSPGKEKLAVTGTRLVSDDNSFEKLNVKVTSKNSEQLINKLFFHPSQEIKELGERYMFISKSALTGTQYLANGTLYTSGGSFTMPLVSFLSGNAYSSLNMTSIHENGFSNNLHYLSSSATLTYSSAAKITKGNELIACRSSITLQKNFQAPGRLILLSNSSITLQDNVNLGKALIIAKGNVYLGNNCRVNGAIFSNGSIRISGPGTFTHDASVVADYASAYFIA